MTCPGDSPANGVMGDRAAYLSARSPSPKLPYRPQPQENTLPADVQTSECSAPQAMPTTLWPCRNTNVAIHA